MEMEHPPKSIKQWYERMTNLDRYYRKSRQEKKRLREQRKMGNLALRLSISANAGETNRQQLLQPQIWLKRQEI